MEQKIKSHMVNDLKWKHFKNGDLIIDEDGKEIDKYVCINRGLIEKHEDYVTIFKMNIVTNKVEQLDLLKKDIETIYNNIGGLL